MSSLPHWRVKVLKKSNHDVKIVFPQGFWSLALMPYNYEDENEGDVKVKLYIYRER